MAVEGFIGVEAQDMSIHAYPGSLINRHCTFFLLRFSVDESRMTYFSLRRGSSVAMHLAATARFDVLSA